MYIVKRCPFLTFHGLNQSDYRFGLHIPDYDKKNTNHGVFKYIILKSIFLISYNVMHAGLFMDRFCDFVKIFLNLLRVSVFPSL